MTEKDQLRQEMLALREQLSLAQRTDAGRCITEKLLACPHYQQVKVVLGYASIRTEFNTREFLEATLRAGKMLVLPRVENDRLTLRQLDDLAVLQKGAFGIAEPPLTAPLIPVDRIDFMLLPGLAFDAHCNRLGYGKGYFDKLLSTLNRTGRHPYLVSAAYSLQLVANVPVDAHDIPIDLLVTENQQIERAS